jgi:hypothetical protein
MAPVIKLVVAAAILSPLLAGCVVYESTGGDEIAVRVGSQTTTAEAAPLESLRDVRFDGGAVAVKVDSNGCTQASDFAVEVADGGTVELTFTRENQDLCKALVPDGVELRWTYEELGLGAGKAVVVRNPVRLP